MAISLKLPPPVLERVGRRFTVVRDDLLEGGSKTRFLPYLIGGAEEVVFGGPFCGGAPLALSVLARKLGLRCTLFYAERGQLHPRQEAARQNGARLEFVSPGYMSNVQAKARTYAERAGARFLPLGFDLPEAAEPFIEVMRGVRKKIGSPDEIWCATGSGMLARCLGLAFPDSRIEAVAVGLASRHEAQTFGQNVSVRQAKLRFEEAEPSDSPFPSCRHYDRKAWRECVLHSKGSVCFWNVAG